MMPWSVARARYDEEGRRLICELDESDSREAELEHLKWCHCITIPIESVASEAP